MSDLAIVGGALFIDRYDASGNKTGEREIASTQGFTVTQSPQKIMSYNNDASGVGVKEDETVVRIDRSASARTRQINQENMALVWAGENATHTQSSGALAETLTGVQQGRWYQLGTSASQPSGCRKVSSETIEVASTGKTAGTDYVLDTDLARLYIVPGGGIANGDDVDVAATKDATSWEQIISSDQDILCAVRIIGQDAKGNPRDQYFPKVLVSVDGEIILKGDPENPAYQDIPLNFEILEDVTNGLAAVYIDGRPA